MSVETKVDSTNTCQATPLNCVHGWVHGSLVKEARLDRCTNEMYTCMCVHTYNYIYVHHICTYIYICIVYTYQPLCVLERSSRMSWLNIVLEGDVVLVRILLRALFDGQWQLAACQCTYAAPLCSETQGAGTHLRMFSGSILRPQASLRCRSCAAAALGSLSLSLSLYVYQ